MAPYENGNERVYPYGFFIFFYLFILRRRLKSWCISRIDRHAATQHHVRMEILSPTLEKGGQGGFEMDGQPIESLSYLPLSKGRGSVNGIIEYPE